MRLWPSVLQTNFPTKEQQRRQLEPVLTAAETHRPSSEALSLTYRGLCFSRRRPQSEMYYSYYQRLLQTRWSPGDTTLHNICGVKRLHSQRSYLGCLMWGECWERLTLTRGEEGSALRSRAKPASTPGSRVQENAVPDIIHVPLKCFHVFVVL